MAPPSFAPCHRPVELAILSSPLPDEVTAAQRGPEHILELVQVSSSLGLGLCWPMFAAKLAEASNKFAAHYPIYRFAGERRNIKLMLADENGDPVQNIIERTVGFTLAEGTWWYRIFATKAPGEHVKSNDHVMAGRLREEVDKELMGMVKENCDDLTKTFWAGWKTLDCESGFTRMIAKVTLGVKESQDANIAVMFIHERQKKAYERDIHFYIRKRSREFGDLPADKPLVTKPAEIRALARREVYEADYLPKHINPKRLTYIPPHRQKQISVARSRDTISLAKKKKTVRLEPTQVAESRLVTPISESSFSEDGGMEDTRTDKLTQSDSECARQNSQSKKTPVRKVDQGFWTSTKRKRTRSSSQ